MGSGVSSLCSCIKSPGGKFAGQGVASPELVFEPLDETLGHSFCYVRSSNRFLLSPTASDRFAVVSPSTSLRFSPSQDPSMMALSALIPSLRGQLIISTMVPMPKGEGSRAQRFSRHCRFSQHHVAGKGTSYQDRWSAGFYGFA